MIVIGNCYSVVYISARVHVHVREYARKTFTSYEYEYYVHSYMLHSTVMSDELDL